jgi:ABC-type branched-subunit amino acid transport system ATPase component
MSSCDLLLGDVFAGYGGGDVLKGVTLAVPQGSVTCIVGPNGAGKSTLLAVVSGLLTPRAGTVTLGGTSLVGRSPREILGLGICQVPQARSLFPSMTVRENLELGGLSLRDRALVKRRREELEGLFPLLGARAHEHAGSLSGGQQRLVEIARALMLDPKVIVLDEPSAGFEPRLARTIYGTIEQMTDAGRTVLLVEQNVRAGLRIATHAVVLESGRVRLEGKGTELLDNPAIGALFLGSPLPPPVQDQGALERSTGR